MAGHRDEAGLSALLGHHLRIVLSALLVGVAVGVVAMAGLTMWTGDAAAAESTAFALGALAGGFGLLGWSASILTGRSIETVQRTLDTNSDWTEADSRRAMARITGFGAGAMVGVSLLAAVLRATVGM